MGTLFSDARRRSSTFSARRIALILLSILLVSCNMFQTGNTEKVEENDGGVYDGWRLSEYSVGPNIYLTATDFPDSLTGYATGGSGSVWKTVDGGKSWVRLITGTMELLNDVHFTDRNTGWVVGEDGGAFKTADGGVTWTSRFQFGSTDSWNSVFFLDSAIGWLAGSRLWVNGGLMQKTVDGGNTWHLMTTNTGLPLLEVVFPDSNHGYALSSKSSIGVGKGTRNTVRRSINGGLNWTADYTVNVWTVETLQALHFLSRDVGFAVGDLGILIKTTDAGASWSLKHIDSSIYLNSIVFIDSLEGWAVGHRLKPADSGSTGVILRTMDGGDSWSYLHVKTQRDQFEKYYSASYAGKNRLVIVGNTILVFERLEQRQAEPSGLTVSRRTP